MQMRPSGMSSLFTYCEVVYYISQTTGTIFFGSNEVMRRGYALKRISHTGPESLPPMLPNKCCRFGACDFVHTDALEN